MNKEEIATLKDRTLLILANKNRSYKELAEIMNAEISTVITISKELEKDDLIHIIDTSSKTSRNSGELNILPKGRYFINSNSYKQKYQKLKFKEKNLKLLIAILSLILTAIGLYYTIKYSH